MSLCGAGGASEALQDEEMDTEEVEVLSGVRGKGGPVEAERSERQRRHERWISGWRAKWVGRVRDSMGGDAQEVGPAGGGKPVRRGGAVCGVGFGGLRWVTRPV